MSRLDHVVEQVTDSFESYDYALGRDALEKFFWSVYCDNYLEIIKHRFWHPEAYDAKSTASAQSTLWESLRLMLSLIAPYLPFVTEEIYQRAYAHGEDAKSVHVTSWPSSDSSRRDAGAETSMKLVLQALEGWRFARSNAKLPARQAIERIILEVPDDVQRGLTEVDDTLRSALRVNAIEFGDGDMETGHEGWKISVALGEESLP
jgi:valyl-tRNA synthetase